MFKYLMDPFTVLRSTDLTVSGGGGEGGGVHRETYTYETTE